MLKKRKLNDCVPEYNDKKADVIMVSSDGWEFRVQSYVLKSASTVLRAKLPRLVRGEEIIKLVDAELEDRRTVFDFLDLITAHKLFEYSDKVQAIHTSRLVRLLRMLYRYDCQGFLAFLRQQISILLSRDGLDGPRLFCAASQLDDAVLMSGVVKHKGPKEFKFPVGVDKKSPLDLKEGVPGASVMDIASMPISFFKSAHPLHRIALLRAHAVKIRSTREAKGDWQAIAEAFYLIVTGKSHPDAVKDRQV